MYSLVSAFGVTKGQGSRWGSIDIGTTSVYQLYAIYRKIYLTLSNNYLNDPVVVDFDSLRVEFSAYDETLNVLLASLGNRTLEVTTTPPVLNPKYAFYSDAFRAGYKIKPVNLLSTNAENLPISDKTSLKISRHFPDTDMSSFHKHCLLSVNGFFHKTDYDGTYAYGVEAASSMLKSHQNQLGILSFLNLGEIENVSITEDMIFAQAENSNLKDRTFIKLNKDVTDKTIMLVLGGYLLFLDGKSFMQTGDDVFSLDFSRMPFLERFLEAAPYVNYDSLGLSVSTVNSTAVSLPELMSDEVIKKFLALPQTFFCILNTPEIFLNRINVKDTGLPGMFIAYAEPKYPLVVSNGRVSEYWKVYEDGQWSMNVYDSNRYNRVASTVPSSTLGVVSQENTPGRVSYNSSGYLLEIGKDF